MIQSCVGTVDATGRVVASLPDALSEGHFSAAAIRAKKRNNPPYWGSHNTVLRSEPTWGDIDVLIKLLTCLCPGNSANLLAAFSSAHASAKALQVIRNGAAHNHSQNLSEIQALRSSYIAYQIGHPTHALFWVEPNSSDFLVTHAIGELMSMSQAAIS